MMGESTSDLKQQYDVFLREQRFNFPDRIITAVDDYRHLLNQGSAIFGGPRVAIKMSELRSAGSHLSYRLRHDPLRHMRALELACHELASENRTGYDKECGPIKVSLAGPIGAHAMSPRHLASSSLRQLVCVEGVATRVSTPKVKIVESVHYCPNTGKHIRQEYVDSTDQSLGLAKLDGENQEMPDKIINITSSVYPTKDTDGNLLEIEFGLSKYKNHQRIGLQEMPEKAPMGQLPRSVELILEHDLVDKAKPGDRIMIVGVFRALATSSQGQRSSATVFRTVILVNSIQIIGRDLSHLTYTPADIRSIRSISKRDDILSVLGRSIAPSIHGHSFIKKALALQLLSGVEKNLENGTHLRGDINILLVGDPSTAKSQLLRSAISIAPLAIQTTGKGSSGVGLTAAVTHDPDTKERRLEAGAMVLADRGLICIDEFDKMSESDRVSIHEVMEQQTVTIAKAGLFASLNARCSVLAAANPVYGQYNRRKLIQENIGLPDSLLTRFDLVFVVLDHKDREMDRRIASHVMKGHIGRTEIGLPACGVENDSDSEDENDYFHSPEDQNKHSIWQRTRHNSSKRSNENTPQGDEVLQHDFLRKYLHYAKARVKPILGDEACEFISKTYVELRDRQSEKTLPITARSLETIIRLSTAHAKARLSKTIEVSPDCEAAMEVFYYALYHEQNQEVEEIEQSMTQNEQKKEKMSAILTNNANLKRGSESINALSPKKSRPNDVQSKLKQTIWTLLSENGVLDLSNLPKELLEISDKDTIQSAFASLSDDGRIVLADDHAFQV